MSSAHRFAELSMLTSTELEASEFISLLKNCYRINYNVSDVNETLGFETETFVLLSETKTL